MVAAGVTRPLATGARSDGETRIDMSGELKTWTFVGHWDNDEIVIEYEVLGEADDPREDTGRWEQGLFAASASGYTIEEAEAAMRAEYEGEDEEYEEPQPWHSGAQEAAAERISRGLPYLNS